MTHILIPAGSVSSVISVSASDIQHLSQAFGDSLEQLLTSYSIPHYSYIMIYSLISVKKYICTLISKIFPLLFVRCLLNRKKC